MELAKKILKYTIFFAIGVLLFWWVYRNFEFEKLETELHRVNWFWIVASITFSLLSHLSRAIRWRMLVKPLGYKMGLLNTYLAVLIMYFANILVPRAGEVARCTVLTKYEKVPFTNLIGTVVIERIADTLMMIFLSLIIFTYNYDKFIEFFNLNPEMKENFFHLFSTQNIIIGLVAILIVVLLIFFFKPFKNTKIGNKIKEFSTEFKNGILTIAKLENKWYFIFHTLLIFTLWLFMFSAVFLAYPPTEQLSLGTGIFVFLMSGFAMLVPVQAGIGAWHFVVIQALLLYGIEKSDGETFALIGHTSTNLIYLVVGFIALMILPLVNRKVKKENVA